jgi:TatA/E family protein of Tat protein translocase
MPFGVGQWEILLLAAVLVLLFGTSQVPKIARNLGRSVREMKETVEGVDPRTPLKELDRPAEDKDVER